MNSPEKQYCVVTHAAGSYSGEVSYFKQGLTNRISYMDKTFGN
jgi:hypothetical protein